MRAKQGGATTAPRLRFPEFRHALSWQEESLGGLSELFKGKGLPKSEIASDAEAPCIHYGELFTLYSEVINEVVSRTQKKTGAFLSIPDDVLMPTSDVTPNGLAKASCLKSGSVVLGGDILVIRTNQRVLLGEFLARQIRHRERDVLKLVSGTTVFHLYPSSVKNLRVAYPNTGEQRKIANCLTSLDEVIAAQGRKVEALKAHKRGLMQQLFPREGETRPRLRLPEFRDAPEWRVDPLSRYIQTLDAGVSVNSGDRSAREEEVGVLKTSCVTEGVFEPSENKVVLEADELGRVKEPVRANTIIISRMNTMALVGANAFVERDIPSLFLPDRLWAAKPTGKGHPRFLACVLGSDQGRAALSELAAGSSGTMKNIGKADVLSLKVSAPVLAEQQRIADFLTSVDTQITAESHQLAALKTHKQGLMQQLFPAPDAATA